MGRVDLRTGGGDPRGPRTKRAQDADFTGPLNYAYHFDATSLAAWLRQMAQARGVQRIETTIASARLTPEGQIAAILPKDGSPEITGDFFIDCSGLSAMLIGDALGSPFVPVSDVLMNDRAVALQIPDAARPTDRPLHAGDRA
jgi:flavin-dependent dehydrogenase